MLSGTGKMREVISPSLTTKQVYDDYQKAMEMDLWNTHYEVLSLSLSLRQRMGEQLNDLGFDELRELEENMENAVTVIRDRKV
ncbi:Transcription factor, K-box [Dillenia turbinata]|uniref:Transcription factor, K-box n=1 Tax=Dillenia turbinata TaxID=194707 RepID=A0AAN8ZFE7_9MAGN